MTNLRTSPLLFLSCHDRNLSYLHLFCVIWSDREGEVVFWLFKQWYNYYKTIIFTFSLYEQRDARKARGTTDFTSGDPYNMEDIAMPLLNYINDPIAHEIVHNGATFQVPIHILHRFYLCSCPKCWCTNLIYRLQGWQTTLIYLNHMRCAIVLTSTTILVTMCFKLQR